ncbi:MAG TPA: purine-nucleoside phosphorylase [Clostridia bacterium]
MNEIYKKADETARFISSRLSIKPSVAVILGSGLGSLVDVMEDTSFIDYSDIPNFPVTTVSGHAGQLAYGSIGSTSLIAMKGRFHFYEGYDVSQVVFPVRVMRLMGISTVIVTNAAGGINKNLNPSDLMLIKDHISLFAPSPLRGPNINELGDRFPDMSEVYNMGLLEYAFKKAASIGIDVKEGVYAFTQGPMYETPSEIRALQYLGADAVGMSTVPEVIAARHAGLKVLGISCITNMAAGILDKPLCHSEVIENAKKAEARFVSLVSEIIRDIK